MKRLSTVWVLALALVFSGAAWAAQGRGGGQKPKGKPTATEPEKGKPEAKGEKGKGEKGKEDKGGKPAGVPALGKGEADQIHIWFQTNKSGLPPGLAKREPLPPGLQRQLVKNGTLPPGLQKKIQPLPPALEVKLPKLPVGYKRVVIGDSVVLIEEKNFLVLDIIPDVIVIK